MLLTPILEKTWITYLLYCMWITQWKTMVKYLTLTHKMSGLIYGIPLGFLMRKIAFQVYSSPQLVGNDKSPRWERVKADGTIKIRIMSPELRFGLRFTPVFHVQSFDAAKFTFVVGNKNTAKGKGVGGNKQAHRADDTPCSLEPRP
jgi:hypothetical protein